jgi:hypothetical protein
MSEYCGMDGDLKQVIDAASALKCAPTSAYRDGMSAAEWYRNVRERQKAISAMQKATLSLQSRLCDTEEEASNRLSDAQSMVLECAASGDIE